jgi:hypothetical protein
MAHFMGGNVTPSAATAIDTTAEIGAMTAADHLLLMREGDAHGVVGTAEDQ